MLWKRISYRSGGNLYDAKWINSPQQARRLLNFRRTLFAGDRETGFNHKRPDSFFVQVDIVQFCKLFTRQHRPKSV